MTPHIDLGMNAAYAELIALMPPGRESEEAIIRYAQACFAKAHSIYELTFKSALGGNDAETNAETS